jgi:hypothetical protein
MSDYTADTITRDDRPGWRARIEYDPCAEPPFDDYAAHVVSLDDGTTEPGYVNASRIREAWEHYRHGPGDAYELLTRYLGMWHGATHVEFVTPPEGYWIVFDSPERREEWGCAPERVPSNVEGTAEEWRAYVVGEVYGVIVERHRTGTIAWNDGTTDELENWGHVDSCWGFYGAEYAKQEARRMLDEASAPTPIDA